ncbi:MAG: alanine racemase [Anaerohalosphaeraceae bacterium]|nr:alanine racemase [Anaerohalosphaeraceae bacterium]
MFKRKDLQAYLYPEALLHNVKTLKSCCRDNVKFCAVVKANAYGHGISEVVDILKNAEVDFFAVANIYEAFYITEKIDTQQILVFEPLHSGLLPEEIVQCAQLDIHGTITSSEAAEYVSLVLNEQQVKLKVHINIDTGMGRCGVSVSDAKQLVELVCNSKSMELAGIYTHFANADEKDLSFAKEQLDSFKKVLKTIDKFIDEKVIIHVANSSATMRLPDAHFDMVCCGISIYGYSTIEKPLPVALRPALRLEVPIIHITTIEKDQTVSYGRTFTAKRKTKIAVLPIGYSDGFWRFFSNNVTLIVNNKPTPVIGRVTMNQMVIDVTDIADVQPGALVTVIDDKYDSPCGVYTLAKLSKTICYEILTNIPPWANVIIAK